MTRRLAVVAALALLWPAGLAAAQQPGVFIDPSSPSAKEYTLPLAAARSVDGGSPTAPQQAQEPPLFGQGITPVQSSRSQGSGATQDAAGTGATPSNGGGSHSRHARSAKRRSSSSPANSAPQTKVTVGAGGAPPSTQKPFLQLVSLSALRYSGASTTPSELYLLALVLGAGALFGVASAMATRRRDQPRS